MSDSARRSGLPKSFALKRNRHTRTLLLEENIYRLPDGREFVPREPSGVLGGRHPYALLSPSQYHQRRNGSIYVRTDGRIFDYSKSTTDSQHDLFDTGFTIADLERTGRYADRLEERSKRVGEKGRRGEGETG